MKLRRLLIENFRGFRRLELEYERPAQDNLGSSSSQDRYGLPYRNIETHLLESGFSSVYASFMPQQNLVKIQKTPGDAGYWAEYADNLPSRAKTRAAAAVAAEILKRGKDGVTAALKAAVEKAVAWAAGESP